MQLIRWNKDLKYLTIENIWEWTCSSHSFLSQLSFKRGKQKWPWKNNEDILE